jgi:hypothetical protein
MRRFRKVHAFADAVQWFEPRDTPEGAVLTEVEVRKAGEICRLCEHPMERHRVLETKPQPIQVCPGDWIVRSPRGAREAFHSMTDEVFRSMYEPVDPTELPWMPNEYAADAEVRDHYLVGLATYIRRAQICMETDRVERAGSKLAFAYSYVCHLLGRDPFWDEE